MKRLIPAFALVLLLSAIRQATTLPAEQGGDYLSYYRSASIVLRGADPYLARYPNEPGWPLNIAPPGAVYVFTPLTLFDEEAGRWVWVTLNAFGLALAGWGAARIAGVHPAWGILAGLIFPTGVLNLRFGNVVPLMCAAFVWGVLWLRTRPRLTGALLGLSAGLKLWPALLWFALDREARLWMLFGVGIVGLLGLLSGPELTIWYAQHPGAGVPVDLGINNVGLVAIVLRWLP